MFAFLTRNISKQQKGNLIALAIALLVLGGIALKNQEKCWEQNSYSVNVGGKSTASFFSKFSRACTPDPYLSFTPPSELSGLVYVPKGNAPARFYVRTDAK